MHKLETIAYFHSFNERSFVEFAIGHSDKYGIVHSSNLGESTVSTVDASALVQDFVKSIDDAKFMKAQV